MAFGQKQVGGVLHFLADQSYCTRCDVTATQVAPSEVVAQRTIRNAMGITCTPASTSASVETAKVLTTVVADAPSGSKTDADINELFVRGTPENPVVL